MASGGFGVGAGVELWTAASEARRVGGLGARVGALVGGVDVTQGVRGTTARSVGNGVCVSACGGGRTHWAGPMAATLQVAAGLGLQPLVKDVDRACVAVQKERRAGRRLEVGARRARRELTAVGCQNRLMSQAAWGRHVASCRHRGCAYCKPRLAGAPLTVISW